jgi:NAD(P)-dependent dehydrogenase (short-subunit alcohol dehydrogenase family)
MSIGDGMKSLENKVALVAGATRGAGRGIAMELGVAGAIVYCSGRSARGKPSDLNRLETIEETAGLVSSLGGVGIAVKTDHSVEHEVKALLERIRFEQGRLDMLVNDIWGGEKLVQWGQKFWELELEKAFKLIERSIYTHIITSRYAAPLLIETGNALLLEISDGEYGYYRGNLIYDFIKNAINRLAKAQAFELRDQGVTVCAITPGFLRSEEMLEHMKVNSDTWQEAEDRTFATQSETPRLIGRGIAALASDQTRARFHGQVLSSWVLMREYGFSDVDGRKPDWGVFWDATHRKDYPEL